MRNTVDLDRTHLTDTLCTQCGLCCDGTMFANVEVVLEPQPARIDSMGLEILNDVTRVGRLSQPCPALSGTRCSIYASRPACCRTFSCLLLQDVEGGKVTVERAVDLIADTQKQIRRLRELLTRAGQPDVHLPLKLRCSRAIDEPGEVTGPRQELSAAMAALDRTISQNFLGSGAPPAPPRAESAA